jgi:hypothetical protein
MNQSDGPTKACLVRPSLSAGTSTGQLAGILFETTGTSSAENAVMGNLRATKPASKQELIGLQNLEMSFKIWSLLKVKYFLCQVYFEYNWFGNYMRERKINNLTKMFN